MLESTAVSRCWSDLNGSLTHSKNIPNICESKARSGLLVVVPHSNAQHCTAMHSNAQQGELNTNSITGGGRPLLPYAIWPLQRKTCFFDRVSLPWP